MVRIQSVTSGCRITQNVWKTIFSIGDFSIKFIHVKNPLSMTNEIFNQVLTRQQWWFCFNPISITNFHSLHKKAMRRKNSHRFWAMFLSPKALYKLAASSLE